MTIEQLIKDWDLSDDRYDCYHPIKSVEIFNYLLDEDTIKDCEINISKKCNLIEILPLVNKYLEWFKECEHELTSYFQEKLGEALPDDWFKNIEVYHFSITFDTSNDFGATISCGDNILSDHILEFDFEMFQVVDDRLNG